MRPDFRQGVEFSHDLFKRHITRGSRVIDATAGNGNDTVFLAGLVGKEGRVYAFDIQQKAIDKTRQQLKERNLLSRVKLIHDGHEKLYKYTDGETVSGVLFNLGFLPRSDKRITTEPSTTLAALKAALKVLAEKGIIVMVIYTGHSGGEEEKEILLDFSSGLDYRRYNVLHYHFINQKSAPAQVLAIKKR